MLLLTTSTQEFVQWCDATHSRRIGSIGTANTLRPQAARKTVGGWKIYTLAVDLAKLRLVSLLDDRVKSGGICVGARQILLGVVKCVGVGWCGHGFGSRG